MISNDSTKVLLGLGGNLGDVEQNFAKALRALEDQSPESVRVSRLYHSSPWGLKGQPDFFNLAAELHWDRGPIELLRLCRMLEREAGRDRERELRWGPRPLDIDILLFGEMILRSEELTVPHARMHERRFVLQPLRDLLPGETRVPGLDCDLATLLRTCPDTGYLTPVSEDVWIHWREL